MAKPNETIVVPRELFERLVEYADELRGMTGWQASLPYRGYADVHAELTRRVAEGVSILEDTQHDTEADTGSDGHDSVG